VNPADYLVDERETSPQDDAGGVARRWAVVHQVTGARRTVVLYRQDGARYAGQPFLECDCRVPRCAHLVAVREAINHVMPPAA
jgi:hypothetical protein